MCDIPHAVEGYVAYEQPDEPTLKAPHEAETLAMNLLSAASEARAYRLAADEDDAAGPLHEMVDQEHVDDVDQDDQGDDPGDRDPQVEHVETRAFGSTD